ARRRLRAAREARVEDLVVDAQLVVAGGHLPGAPAALGAAERLQRRDTAVRRGFARDHVARRDLPRLDVGLDLGVAEAELRRGADVLEHRAERAPVPVRLRREAHAVAVLEDVVGVAEEGGAAGRAI